MSDPVFKLQLLARAELALSEIHVRRALPADPRPGSSNR